MDLNKEFLQNNKILVKCEGLEQISEFLDKANKLEICWFSEELVSKEEADSICLTNGVIYFDLYYYHNKGYNNMLVMTTNSLEEEKEYTVMNYKLDKEENKSSIGICVPSKPSMDIEVGKELDECDNLVLVLINDIKTYGKLILDEYKNNVEYKKIKQKLEKCKEACELSVEYINRIIEIEEERL
ncbi:MAG: hypothetical protein ACRCVJ_12000 [Clostridium sp.]|uniref:hypothetical protein n=1 Tax=Clostridium sp. TaxID=1506 RepID=UPI003F3CBFB6